jgi:transposase-like protein
MFLSKKCPYCRGKNLFVKRTSLFLVFGCRDCDKKVDILRSKGLKDKDIVKIIKW